jgi:3-methylcrotonyl-CoA carboxylase alpha subunit
MKRVQLRTHPEAAPIEVALSRAPGGRSGTCEALVGDRRHVLVIESLGEGSGMLRLDGRVLPLRVLRRGSMIHLWAGGRTYTLEVMERTARRVADAEAALATGTLTAPMPGTVLKINVRAGQRFDAHEPLIVMESMKMEMTLSAPQSGRVAEVLCHEGELVEMNELLARLEGED